MDADLPRQRALRTVLHAAARAMPVVVVTGARQTGKSTLVRDLAADDRLYLTLDDLDVLEQARREPEDLVARSARMTLDEIQRAPELMLAVKRAVDRRRVKGRFFLTGSANLLLLRTVSETLAGRAAYLTLWPMTRREQLGLGRTGIWDELLAAPNDTWRDVIAAHDAPREDWKKLALRGGYPTPALDLDSAAERATWFTGYTKTYLERDLQEIASITALPDFRRLMRAASLRLGQLLNQTELGRDISLPQPTVHRYLNLLETSYQLVRLAPYAVNRTRRLIKTPKTYWCDTGLALHLAGLDEPAGAHLENLVLLDLLAWREGRTPTTDIFYWRTAAGEE
ncbi:MAG TPA: ATP-binding protein, partial [Thermoanaerobaculia bacterium]|nr:ATP-binding protein [Thermoanaerobaculia bacterium]